MYVRLYMKPVELDKKKAKKQLGYICNSKISETFGTFACGVTGEFKGYIDDRMLQALVCSGYLRLVIGTLVSTDQLIFKNHCGKTKYD